MGKVAEICPAEKCWPELPVRDVELRKGVLNYRSPLYNPEYIAIAGNKLT
jgi:hypothetical protein